MKYVGPNFSQIKLPCRAHFSRPYHPPPPTPPPSSGFLLLRVAANNNDKTSGGCGNVQIRPVSHKSPLSLIKLLFYVVVFVVVVKRRQRKTGGWGVGWGGVGGEKPLQGHVVI